MRATLIEMHVQSLQRVLFPGVMFGRLAELLGINLVFLAVLDRGKLLCDLLTFHVVHYSSLRHFIRPQISINNYSS